MRLLRFRQKTNIKPSSRELLADARLNADRADREAIAAMSMEQRLALTLDLSEFTARNTGIVKRS